MDKATVMQNVYPTRHVLKKHPQNAEREDLSIVLKIEGQISRRKL
jgi:hypothetical protein